MSVKTEPVPVSEQPEDKEKEAEPEEAAQEEVPKAEPKRRAKKAVIAAPEEPLPAEPVHEEEPKPKARAKRAPKAKDAAAPPRATCPGPPRPPRPPTVPQLVVSLPYPMPGGTWSRARQTAEVARVNRMTAPAIHSLSTCVISQLQTFATSPANPFELLSTFKIHWVFILLKSHLTWCIHVFP